MDAGLRDDTERWFVRRGIPHFIQDYSATGDIFTRAAPVLVSILFLELFFTFGDRFAGLAQAGVFVVGVAVLLVTAAIVNRVRGRRPLALPDDVGTLEIAAFVLLPPVLRLAVDTDPVWFVGLILLQLVILGVVYFVTSYGLVPMTLWSIAHFVRRVATLGSLLVRVLPLMLVFSLFLFVNAEVWQVANDLVGAYFTIIMIAFGVLCAAFVAWSTAGEAVEIERIRTWDEAADLAADSPLAAACPRGPSRPQPPPLSTAARANVQLLLVFSRLAPVLLVGLAVFVLYAGFGLLTIREETILQWITDDALASGDVLWRGGFLGGDLVLTAQLLYVSGLIAAISGLQFAVSIATEPAARESFAGDVLHEVREAVAVRAAYLSAASEDAET